MEPLTPKPKDVDPAEAQEAYDSAWRTMQACNVAELKRLKQLYA